MMAENKFGKYLIYAIGEILLVVIGILIALNVNNFNENRKQEAKIIEAFKEIHRDLSEDILESNGLITSYKLEDSIINILMTKKMSIEDFKGEEGFNYAYAAANYYDLKMNTNGFELLMANSDNIPENYQSVVESLKKIYIDDKGNLETTLKNTEDAVQDYLSHIMLNMDWPNELYYHGRLTNDAINFYINDAYFKNHLTQYHILAIGNYYQFLYQFRINAENSYQELSNILQLEGVVASDSTLYKINAKDYEHFLGTYKDSTSTAIISIESGKLFYQWKDLKKARLFPISRSSFIHAFRPGFNTIVLDSTGQALGHNWRYGKWQGSLKKTD